MSEPHVIRLRGPWDVEPVEGSQAIRWTRRFGRPTGLENGARVWLCIQLDGGIASWRLNDSVPCAVDVAQEVQRRDITDQLQVRSQLEVIMEQGSEPMAEQLPFDVWLEIVAGNESSLARRASEGE